MFVVVCCTAALVVVEMSFVFFFKQKTAYEMRISDWRSDVCSSDLRYLPELLSHIETGRLSPEVIISHRMSLEQAAEGYKLFDKKQEDCRKVILTPGEPDIALPVNDDQAVLLST